MLGELSRERFASRVLGEIEVPSMLYVEEGEGVLEELEREIVGDAGSFFKISPILVAEILEKTCVDLGDESSMIQRGAMKPLSNECRENLSLKLDFEKYVWGVQEIIERWKLRFSEEKKEVGGDETLVGFSSCGIVLECVRRWLEVGG